MSDYDWTCTAQLAEVHPQQTAEQWLRQAWEGAPGPVSAVLPVAWRLTLGLRLESTSDASTVLGWPITESTDESITVTCDSPMMDASNVLTVDGDVLNLRTTVTYRNIFGRLIWGTTGRLGHQILAPWMLRSAARKAASA